MNDYTQAQLLIILQLAIVFFALFKLRATVDRSKKFGWGFVIWGCFFNILTYSCSFALNGRGAGGLVCILPAFLGLTMFLGPLNVIVLYFIGKKIGKHF